MPTPEVVRGTGGPKKQLASRSHDPVVPLGQPPSVRHASAPVPFTQCLPGPPPSVQSAGPVPGSGPIMTVEPGISGTGRADRARPGRATTGAPTPSREVIMATIHVALPVILQPPCPCGAAKVT